MINNNNNPNQFPSIHQFPSIPINSELLLQLIIHFITQYHFIQYQFPIFLDTSSLLTSQAMVPMGTLSKGTALPTKMGASAEEITFKGTCMDRMDQWNS